jgi:hypothetical protein
MTSNQGLLSELIFKVYNGTIGFENNNPAFAVHNDAATGTPLQGVGR